MHDIPVAIDHHRRVVHAQCVVEGALVLGQAEILASGGGWLLVECQTSKR